MRKVPRPWRVNLRNVIEAKLRQLVPVKAGKTYEILGHHVYLDPRGDTNQEYITGTYEEDVRKVFENYVKSGMSVVDVGAHIGFYTLLAARLVGATGKVYAFEPQPKIRALLTRNVAINTYEDRCRILPYAISNRTSRVPFALNPVASGRSSLVPSANSGNINSIVETITLDTFFSQQEWPRIDFIKMDIEGAEKFALEGMRELSQRNAQLKLVMEFGIELANHAGYGGQDLVAVLIELGFTTGYRIETGMKKFRLENGWPAVIYDNYLLTKEQE